jgi:hypothetical protein
VPNAAAMQCRLTPRILALQTGGMFQQDKNPTRLIKRLMLAATALWLIGTIVLGVTSFVRIRNVLEEIDTVQSTAVTGAMYIAAGAWCCPTTSYAIVMALLGLWWFAARK